MESETLDMAAEPAVTSSDDQQQPEEVEPLFERAKKISLDAYLPSQAHRLLEDAFEEVTGSRFNNRRAKVAEIYGWREGEQLECLIAYEDEKRIFVGEDDTATNAGRFCFIIDPAAGDPPVRTIEEALDLLKPPEVSHTTITLGDEPGRQGEWWLIPCEEEPASSDYKPGVSSRPFGGSPLENHVPREYALGVSGKEFMTRFERSTGISKSALQTPQDVFDWGWRQQQFVDDELIGVPENIPTVRELRELAGGIFVKGTLRHRENDHYMERIGEEWHLAVTHDADVFTPTPSSELEEWIHVEQDNGLYRRERNPEWLSFRRRSRARLD